MRKVATVDPEALEPYTVVEQVIERLNVSVTWEAIQMHLVSGRDTVI